MKSSYFINKDNKTGEIVYLEYNKDGYKVSPKTKKQDAIEVNKIIFVSPTLTEKLLKKKVNTKISKLLLELNTFYEADNNDSDGEETKLRNMLKEAERLKLTLIEKYKKYLDGRYTSLTLKKIQIIIDGYRSRLDKLTFEKRKKEMLIQMLNRQAFFEEESKRGKGR